MSSIPTISAPLKQRVQQRVHECLERLVAQGLLRRPPLPTLRYDLSGTAAGQACSSGVLRFNAHYLLHDSEHFIAQTVAHEVAHYADFLRRGRSDHGRHWQRLMHALGVEARTTHPYRLPLSAVSRLRTFRYRCDCRETELTSIRHKRAQRAASAGKPPLYLCTSCRQPLVYLQEVADC